MNQQQAYKAFALMIANCSSDKNEQFSAAGSESENVFPGRNAIPEIYEFKRQVFKQLEFQIRNKQLHYQNIRFLALLSAF